MHFERSIIWPPALGAMALIWSGGAIADVVVSSAQTQNMSCVSGACVPTAPNAVLNTGDLQTMLGAGNVSVSTTGSGVQASNIVVASKFSWKSGNSLSLDAYDSITVNAPVVVKDGCPVILSTNDGGAGGVLLFGPKGRMEFSKLTSSLNINGAPYMLVNSVSSLASAVKADPAGNYALAADYDASRDGKYRRMPVPSEIDGTLEGLGNTISNLSIHYASNKKFVGGMIWAVASTGTIENLRLENERPHIGKQAAWGGLVGLSYGILFNDSVTGTFKANCSNCLFAGLVATNYNQVLYSSAKVQILAPYAGGLVGVNTGNIFASHADGTITANVAGGLVIYNDQSVDQSYSTVRVGGGDGAMLGGLVGQEGGETTNSYATGSVSGGDGSTVGGLIGQTDDPSGTSYSTGVVSGGASSLIGGFIGKETAKSVQDCYWDTDTSQTDQGTGEGTVQA